MSSPGALCSCGLIDGRPVSAATAFASLAPPPPFCQHPAEFISCATHADVTADANKGCRLAPIPMTASAWDVPTWSVDRLRWGANDMVELGMFKTDGSRINSKDAYAYGITSVRAKVDPTVGAVSAFYVGAACQPALPSLQMGRVVPCSGAA